MKTVRCISLWQPWATALFLPDLKPIETRHWSTPFRGTLAIHAAKMASKEVVSFFNDKLNDDIDTYAKEAFKEFGYNSFSQLPLGAIIGTVEMVACLPTSILPALHKPGSLDGDTESIRANKVIFDSYCGDQEGNFELCYQWGNFGPDRFGWCFRNPILLPKPIPYKGKQGFFSVELPE